MVLLTTSRVCKPVLSVAVDAPDAERGDPTILSWVPLEVDVNGMVSSM